MLFLSEQLHLSGLITSAEVLYLYPTEKGKRAYPQEAACL